MHNFSTNSVVLVLSSEYYDPNDYIENFDEFLKARIDDVNIGDFKSDLQPSICPVNYEFSSTTVDDCRTIELDKHHHVNGNLTVVQDFDPIPFAINRSYYIYDIPGGESRGGHAHRNLRQLLVSLSGSFDVVIDDGTRQRRVTLNRPYQGLVIVPGIWRVLDNFSSGAVCLCIASECYNETDYIREYNDFIQLRKP